MTTKCAEKRKYTLEEVLQLVIRRDGDFSKADLSDSAEVNTVLMETSLTSKWKLLLTATVCISYLDMDYFEKLRE